MISLLNPTGEIYNPNCIKKGIKCLKSLYLVFNADNQIPKPKEQKIVSNIKTGSNNIFNDGKYSYQNINIIKIEKEIKKSIKHTRTVLNGIINLGKYTFVIIFALEITLELASLIIEENNCQGIIPENTNKEYGILSEGNFAILPKTIVNIIIIISGLIIAQATPIAVCLYLTKKSLNERKYSNSL